MNIRVFAAHGPCRLVWSGCLEHAWSECDKPRIQSMLLVDLFWYIIVGFNISRCVLTGQPNP